MTQADIQNSAASLHQALQQSTRAQHEALHVHPRLCKLAAADVARDDWVNALTGFYGFYAAAEASLESSARPLSRDFADGKRMAALTHDLQGQGIDVALLPSMPPLAPMATDEDVLAYLCLREGSALGGTVISRNLEARCGIRPGEDNAFFHGAGRDAGRNWQAFVGLMADQQDNIDISACADAARGYFSLLDSWLSQGRIQHGA